MNITPHAARWLRRLLDRERPRIEKLKDSDQRDYRLAMWEECYAAVGGEEKDNDRPDGS